MLDGFTTAVTFLMFGLVLIVAEVLIPGYFIAVPGGALVFMGAIGLAAPRLMFDSPWSWFLWPLAAVVSTGINLWAYKHWSPAGKAPLTMSIDSLPGETGTVTVAVEPDSMSGKVRIRGHVWSARGDAAIPAGTAVRVVRAEGVCVWVEATGALKPPAP